MTSTRFTSKVLFVTVLPVVTTALILASILISERIDDFNKRINEKGNTVANYISQISEYGIFSNNFSYIETTLLHTLKQPDIVSILIEDNKKTVVLKKTSNSLKNKDIQNLNKGHYRTFTSKILKTSIELNDIDTEPLQNTKSYIGTVYVVMDLKNANITKTSIIIEGVFITLLSTIATILVALLFSQSVTKPITTIHTGVDLIKNGELQHRIPVDFSGELAELAQGINDMTASLETAHAREKQQAEDVLFIEKTKAQITLESIGDGVITTDINGNVTYLNPTAENLTGFSLKQALNKPLSSIFKIRHHDSNELNDYPIMTCIQSLSKIHHESGCILKCKDGSEYTIREIANPILDKEGKVAGAVLVFHDFSNIKNMSDTLEHQATHDVLTGLLNRRAFENRMHDIINTIKPVEAHALCYIDLDRFKIINDTCGHLAGDKLLKLISSRINENIRKNDLFARLGGDEFGVIFFNCDIQRAKMLAENIKTAVSEIKFSWETHSFNVGLSIGVVPITYGENMTDIMMTVDTACYVAKDKGRNRVHVYEQNDEDILKREGDLQWFQKINKALDNNDFVLYSQRMAPFANNNNNDIHEILLRLNLNDELILPATFIPAAERYSLMHRVDKWVIKTAFREIKNHKDYQSNARFSINLSGQTITDETFIDFLNKELDSNEIPADRFIFEITETAAISNFNDAIFFIQQFKERGCRFALDDFGSGMSSFQYLNELPVDYIKIDGSFVKNICDMPYNQSVIKSISQIGHSLGLEIVAEYVENDKILAALDKSQIDYVQGYAIEKPHPLI